MRALLSLVLSVAACQGTSGGHPDVPDGGQDPKADADNGGGAPLLGSLKVSEVHAPWGDSGVVQGSVWTSEFVGFHTELMNDGVCRLLTFEPSFCDPGCEQGMCVAGVCREYSLVDAGTLTVTGVPGEVLVEPQDYPFGGHGYWTVLERADLFGDGDLVTVTAPGGDFPGFELSAGGVGELALALDNDEIQVPNGGDHTFSWPPSASEDERLRLTLNANNEFHGAPYRAIIECDAPASAGAVTIPRQMIEAFPATEHWQGCAGSDCPPSHALLYRRGAVDIDGGEVELMVGSEVLFYVVHPAPDGAAARR